MDLNEIFLFAKVVDAESFTGAARALGVPKSTVSRKIAQLEERLGAQLLHRTTRQLRLTDIGAAYYERCARIAAELEDAERQVLDMQSEPRGLLRVTAPVECGFVGELAAEFLARHPGVEFDIELTGRRVDLLEEGFDLAIRAGSLPDSTMIARKLGTATFVLCASPAYLDARGVPETPVELMDHTCIVFGSSERRRKWRLHGADGPVEVVISGPLATNNLSVVLHAAIAGVGIAMLPPSVCSGALASGALRTVLDGAVPPQGSVYAIYPSTRRLSAKVRAFLDFLCQSRTISLWADGDTSGAL